MLDFAVACLFSAPCHFPVLFTPLLPGHSSATGFGGIASLPSGMSFSHSLIDGFWQDAAYGADYPSPSQHVHYKLRNAHKYRGAVPHRVICVSLSRADVCVKPEIHAFTRDISCGMVGNNERNEEAEPYCAGATRRELMAKVLK